MRFSTLSESASHTFVSIGTKASSLKFSNLSAQYQHATYVNNSPRGRLFTRCAYALSHLNELSNLKIVLITVSNNKRKQIFTYIIYYNKTLTTCAI